MKADELYMQRCLQLAKLGEGNVAPNPMVGAVLVFKNKIISEGYHKNYGEAHAEVNCIQSVKEEYKDLISQSTLYVSLEPCAHFGKTPPCSDLIIEKQIPKVVIGCSDIFSKVNGKGIEKLKRHKIEVVENILNRECIELNKRFFTFYAKQRPFIILKWAQTADNKIAYNNSNRLFITGPNENRLVHKWRFEESGIFIGTDTALKDNPELTNRFWNGKSPVRLIIDMDLKLPETLKVFDSFIRTIIFNKHKQSDNFPGDKQLTNKILYWKIEANKNVIHEILYACYRLNIQSVLIEGGTKTLQSFIDENLWDEAKILINHNIYVGDGLNAPAIINYKTFEQIKLSERCKLLELKNNISYN